MAGMQKGLGRGLGALFQDDAPESKAPENTQTLPVGTLVPNPNQPRRDFDQEALNGLAESIKNQGILQPILVRPVAGSKPPRYEIIAGERRWRAAQLVGLAEVPIIIRELSDQETLAVALIENLQREDLSPLEEALGMQELKDEFGLSQEELASTLGKSRSAIANILRLLNLSPRAQDALRSGAISAGHARSILSLGSPSEQESLLSRIIEGGLSVRETEGWVATQKAGAAAAETAAPAAENAATAVAGAAVAGAAPGANAAPDAPLAATATPAPARAKKLPQSAILLDLQERFSDCVGLPVRFSGRENKGKISISYSSREELATLLQRIGLGAEL